MKPLISPDRSTAVKRKWFAGAMLCCWFLSLALPAISMSFDSGYSRRTLAGYQVLVSGFYGIAAGQFSWLANFPLAAVLIGLTSYSMSERATAWSAILLLALSADLLDFVIRPAFWGHSQLLIGGYLWLITNLISAAFALVATTSKLAIVK